MIEFVRLICLIIWLGISPIGSLIAQTNDNLTPIPKKTPPIFEHGVAQPDAYFLLDKLGNPILVPRVSYEEFERFLRQQSNQANPAIPGVGLDSMEGVAEVKGSFVEIQWRARASVATVTESTARISLGMPNQVLVDSPSILSGQNNYVRRDPNGGFEWLLSVESNRQYEIAFTTRIKRNEVGTQSSVRLDLPDVRTSLQLTIPDSNLEVQTTGPTTAIIETEHRDEKTKAQLNFGGGTLSIQWQKPNEANQNNAIELDSSMKWVINTDGRQWIGSSRFVFKAYGKKSSRDVRIRLPLGVRWNQRQPAVMDDSVSLDVEVEPTATTGETIHIRFTDFGDQAREELTLEWEWNPNLLGSGQVAFQGLDVEGVQRHEGRLDIESQPGERFSWNPSSDVTLIEPLSTDSLSIRHSFRLINPNYRFMATVSKEENRMLIRPTYVVNISSTGVSLKGSIEFGTNPIRFNDLKLHLGKFVLDRLEFNGRQIETRVIDDGVVLPMLDGVTLDRPSPTAPPLGFTMAITANMPWDVESNHVRIMVPQISYPNGNDRYFDRGTGELILTHDRNLHIRQDSFTGLVPQSRLASSNIKADLKKELENPLEENKARLFHFESRSAEPTWSASIERLQRQIIVRRTAEIRIDPRQVRTEQRFEFSIENEAIPRMQFLIPKTWLQSKGSGTDLRVLANKQEIAWTQISENQRQFTLPADFPTSDWGTIELNNSNWLGKVVFEFVSHAPLADLSDGKEVAMELPIVWTPSLGPGELVIFQESVLKTAPGLVCKIPQELLADPTNRYASSRRVLFSGNQYSIPCKLRQVDSIASPKVTLERAWLQTALSASLRRDRFVASLRTSQNNVECVIPERQTDRPVKVFVDGVEVIPIPLPDGQRISIPLEATESNHLVEIWTSTTQRPREGLTEIQALFPSIQNASQGPPILWQVIVPPNETLVWTSSALVPQYRWTTRSIGLARTSDYRQSEIEAWMGTTHQPEIEQLKNDYVLSSLGIEQTLSIWIVPRTWIWFPLGALILLGTALWYRFRFLRHPWFLVALTVGMACFIPSAPDLAIILLQGIACSTILIAALKICQWAVDRRVQRRSIFKTRPSTYHFGRPIDRSIQAQPVNGSTVDPSPPAVAEVGE